jgi:hypothetical protein
MAMDDQMEVMFKSNRTGYALGGEVEQVDPVSGNEIPPGSFANEVRDDIPAMLSEGEYVVPADVVRFYGVKFLEDLRTEAKIGLARMEENGRIGGEPTDDNDDLTPEEMALLDEVMSMEDEPVGMAVGGMVGEQTTPAALDPYQQQAVMSQAPVKAAYGIDLQPTNSYDKPYGITTGDEPATTFIAGESKYVDAVSRLGDSGIVNKTYIHKDGRSIVVQFYNGQPLGVTPPDFSEFKPDTPENRTDIGYGGTTEEEDTDTADSTTDNSESNSNKSDNDNDTLGEDVYKAGTDGTLKTKYIRKDGSVNTDQMNKDVADSKVNIADPLAGATAALDGGGSRPNKGIGFVLSKLGGPIASAAYASYHNIREGTKLANARANLQAAKHFGTNDGKDAEEIQKQIDAFLGESSKMLGGKILDSLASGDKIFQDALDLDKIAKGNTTKVVRADSNAPKETIKEPESEGFYESITGKKFSETNLGKALGVKTKTPTVVKPKTVAVSNPKTITDLKTSSGQVSVNKTNTPITGSTSEDGNWQQVVNPGTNAITRKWVG